MKILLPKLSFAKTINKVRNRNTSSLTKESQPSLVNVFEGIAEHNIAARKKLPIAEILKNRNANALLEIPYQKDYGYRCIGEGGYKDFLETGLIRAKQGTKIGYEKVYFEKGAVCDIYARKGGGRYIVETPLQNLSIESGFYPHTDSLKKGVDGFRIWEQNAEGGYKIVYDTIGDLISKHPKIRANAQTGDLLNLPLNIVI